METAVLSRPLNQALGGLTSEEEGQARDSSRAAMGESAARRARWGRAAMLILVDWARVAAVASASGAFSHPASYRISTAVVAINLVNRINGTATRQVAHHSTIAAVISLGLGGDCKSKNGED